MIFAAAVAASLVIQDAPAPAAQATEETRRAAMAAVLAAMGGPRSQEEFERDELRKAGLPSLEAAAEAGRDVVQLSLNDPRFMFAVPALQVEATDDGATLSVFTRQGLVLSRALSPEQWRAIADTDIMQRRPAEPARPPEAEPPPIVHRWIARFGRASDGVSRTSSASGASPKMRLADDLVRLALRERPECDQAIDANPFFAFHHCFSRSGS